MATTPSVDDVTEGIQELSIGQLLGSQLEGLHPTSDDTYVFSYERQVEIVEAVFAGQEDTKALCLSQLTLGTPLKLTSKGDAVSHAPSFTFPSSVTTTHTVTCHVIRQAVSVLATPTDGVAARVKAAVESLSQGLVVACATKPCLLKGVLDGLPDHGLATPPPHTHTVQGIRCRIQSFETADPNGDPVNGFKITVTGSVLCEGASLWVLLDTHK